MTLYGEPSRKNNLAVARRGIKNIFKEKRSIEERIISSLEQNKIGLKISFFKDNNRFKKRKLYVVKIIDAHVHCGNSRLEGAKFYPKDQMLQELKEVNASGAVVMAFPEDIYRNGNTEAQRNKANEYILKIAEKEKDVHPFYFVWNDYIIPDNLSEYSGIKWHRHEGEPAYDYNSSACKDFLNEIKKLAIPVLLEEEFINTIKFIENNPELTIIIPHIGESNGGPEKMEIFFDNPNVFFDTAITNKNVLQWAYDSVGPERLIFGTDSSACRPFVDNSLPVALKRHRELHISDEDMELIFSKNIEKILRV